MLNFVVCTLCLSSSNTFYAYDIIFFPLFQEISFDKFYQTYNNTSSDGTLAHADAMYGLLKMQERRNKIPADMPEGVNVANKTGELDTVENDAGIVYNTAKGIDLVICFMSENLSDTGNAQAVIAQDSRMIYGYYNE